MYRRPSLLLLVWIVIGIIVAASRGYFDNVSEISGILSALLAVLAWPLVLLGVKVAI